MAKQTFFGSSDGLFPGVVLRLGEPIEWASILKASEEKDCRAKKNLRASLGSDRSISHASVSSSEQHSRGSNHVVEDVGGRIDSSQQKVSRKPVSDGISTTMTRFTSSEKLANLLGENTLNIEAVRKLAWAGLPDNMRAPMWKALLGYVPTNFARRKDTLERKRREYREAVKQHYDPLLVEREHVSISNSNTYSRAGNQEDVTMRQISVDIPRTSPGQALFHIPQVQLALKRILYVWATRHPASGYVQGMNDLATPFLFVFLSEYAKEPAESSALHMTDLCGLEDPEDALRNAEADSYWCLTALLNDIQDYYTFSQPGIQRRVHFLRELVARVDGSLCSHLEEEGLDFLQFAFRWMNCLLMRELPFPLIVRVWDTYLAETEGFATFHVYVCAALLVSFSEDLQELDFQDLVMFLQNLPTHSWTSREIDVILSQAYMWRTIFGAAPSHLQ